MVYAGKWIKINTKFLEIVRNFHLAMSKTFLVQRLHRAQDLPGMSLDKSGIWLCLIITRVNFDSRSLFVILART